MKFTAKERDEMLLFIENEILMANKAIERRQAELKKIKNKTDIIRFIERTKRRIVAYENIAAMIGE